MKKPLNEENPQREEIETVDPVAADVPAVIVEEKEEKREEKREPLSDISVEIAKQVERAAQIEANQKKLDDKDEEIIEDDDLFTITETDTKPKRSLMVPLLVLASIVGVVLYVRKRKAATAPAVAPVESAAKQSFYGVE